MSSELRERYSLDEAWEYQARGGGGVFKFERNIGTEAKKYRSL